MCVCVCVYSPVVDAHNLKFKSRSTARSERCCPSDFYDGRIRIRPRSLLAPNPITRLSLALRDLNLCVCSIHAFNVHYALDCTVDAMKRVINRAMRLLVGLCECDSAAICAH